MKKFILFFIFSISLFPCRIYYTDEMKLSLEKSALERENFKNLILNNEYNNVQEAYKILKNLQALTDDNDDLYLYVLVKNKRLDLLELLFYKSKSNAGKIYALRGIFELNPKKYYDLKKKEKYILDNGVLYYYSICPDIFSFYNFLQAIENEEYIDFNSL